MSPAEIQNIIEATACSIYPNENQASSNQSSLAFADSVPAIQPPVSLGSVHELGMAEAGNSREPPHESRSSSRMLPCILMPNISAMLEKIREGKFIDLSTCQANHFVDDDQKFGLIQEKGEGDGFSLVKKTRSKKISSFQELAKAFSCIYTPFFS